MLPGKDVQSTINSVTEVSFVKETESTTDQLKR